MLGQGQRKRSRPTSVTAAACLAIVTLLFAGGCSSDGSDVSATIEEPVGAAATAAPTSTAVATTPPLPTATPTAVAPTPTPEPISPTPTADFVDPEVRAAFCAFVRTRYFWESGVETEFLALMPENVPTSIVRQVRAREILTEAGLGDPTANSMANMILITAFASDLGRYLQRVCPGADWVEIAVAHAGDADLDLAPDALLPASALDVCASLTELERQLAVERGRSDPARQETVAATQTFASAVSPDAPFVVLAFSHLLLTQVTLSSNEVAFDLYIDLAFDRADFVDSEAVSVHFDLVCPEVSDTRLWLTPPRAAGAIPPPGPTEGLPDGWEVVPPEDVRSSFSGDLRSLPAGDLTPLLTKYPNFEFGGVEFTNLSIDWLTKSVDPAAAHVSFLWTYSGDELPVDVSQFLLVGPDGTRYAAAEELSNIQPSVIQLVFVLDVIPEGLSDWQFGAVPG